jgi:hypothetical protein
MKEETNGGPVEPERYPLDDALISMLGELDPQIALLQSQRMGALVLFLRQQKLTGNWNVAPNGKELVKAPDPVVVAPPLVKP